MSYWHVWWHGVFVSVPMEGNDKPPLSVNDEIEMGLVIEKATRLSDLFGPDWEKKSWVA